MGLKMVPRVRRTKGIVLFDLRLLFSGKFILNTVPTVILKQVTEAYLFSAREQQTSYYEQIKLKNK